MPLDIEIKSLPDVVNIATMLGEEELTKIATRVIEDYKEDNQSRSEWLERRAKAMKLALQVYEEKNWPWPKASNIKYPLMTMASLAFHARAYPMLIPSKNILMSKLLGFTNDIRSEMARRVQAHMNYQLSDEMENWEEEMDRLLITLPITGSEFKKIYYDEEKGTNCSTLINAENLVINYYAKSLAEASRKTEIINFTYNQLIEKIRAELFLDCLDKLNEAGVMEKSPTIQEVQEKVQGTMEPKEDSDTPHTVLEWHGFLDLDEDGYKEPYVVTVHKDLNKVLRIVARFQSENVTIKDGKIVKIVPDEYYTQYIFIPSPDGGIYGIGFGTLVGPLNEAVNSLINQLVDAGTLSNLQGGFISKALRVRSGQWPVQPGQWLQVNATGQEISKGLFQIPAKEPSAVLFNLITFLISSGERLTSTTDIMTGENPGQNQKATTTQAVIEQGHKVFTAIYKRIRAALSNEFLMLYKLNSIYLDPKEYRKFLYQTEGREYTTEEIKQDYVQGREYFKVIPTADPNAISHLQKMEKLQAIGQLLQLGTINPLEYTKRYLEVLEVDSPEALMIPPPQGPTPEEIELQLEAQNSQVDNMIKMREQDRKEMETLHKVNKEGKQLELESFKVGAEVGSNDRKLDIDEKKAQKEKPKPNGKNK